MHHGFFSRKIIIAFIYFISIYLLIGKCFAQSQDSIALSQQQDLLGVFNKWFNKKITQPTVKPSTTSVLPAIGYNPSIGFMLGVNIAGGKYLGNKDSTTLSVFTLGGYFTTKGVITGLFKHNIFTNGNKWNFQGNWQLSRIVTLDYGVGTGQEVNNEIFPSYGIPVEPPATQFPIKYTYIRLSEKAYRRIANHLYAGLGISFDLRTKINDQKLDTGSNTPHYVYSLAKNVNPTHYAANGILFNMQFNTREHPNRSHKGIYAEMNLRLNQKWLGSTENALQLYTEIRKYISLSQRNPEHVLALWHWGCYRLNGTIPYLELPGTGYDTYSRSGRGYTIGRFKGLSFVYGEAEYRFPISQNKLFSGVAFANVQSGSNTTGTKLLQYFEPAYGGGLRILFNKNTRTNVCIDYAFGRYGSRGLFFGLNEAF